MARVTLQNVAKSFGGDRGPWAVQDFSLDIADGELVVFVGPSGCGKSTTLRMLAGLDDVTFGKILIDEGTSPRFRRKIATLRWFFRTTLSIHRRRSSKTWPSASGP
jgi:ABC-type sugar transport system ATPase subunit